MEKEIQKYSRVDKTGPNSQVTEIEQLADRKDQP